MLVREHRNSSLVEHLPKHILRHVRFKKINRAIAPIHLAHSEIKFGGDSADRVGVSSIGHTQTAGSHSADVIVIGDERHALAQAGSRHGGSDTAGSAAVNANI